MARRAKSRLGRTLRRVVRIAVAIPALCAMLFGGWFWLSLQAPEEKGAARRFVVKKGAGAWQVARQLEREGIVRSARAFAWYSAATRKSARIHSGSYRLSPSLPAWKVLEQLVEGSNDSRRVTLPEGLTLVQIADRLADKEVIADKQGFLDLVTDAPSSLRNQVEAPEGSLEGFLYPDTYEFEPGQTNQQVVETLLKGFIQNISLPNLPAIRRSAHSLHELITIASLIEREAETSGDRPLIAGVIENRLKRNMRLQIDASVIYSLGKHKSRVLYADLKVDSPYNTYLHAGLPPGPIAAPGKDSFLAGLKPAKHDYLYYVATPGGAHLFTRTLAEHNAAVRRIRAFGKTNARG